jgi:hypothetical protein
MLFQPLLWGRNVWNKTSATKQLVPSLSILGEQVGAHHLDVAPTAIPTKIFLELVLKVQISKQFCRRTIKASSTCKDGCCICEIISPFM